MSGSVRLRFSKTTVPFCAASRAIAACSGRPTTDLLYCVHVDQGQTQNRGRRQLDGRPQAQS
eukprot:SAG22_NODE_1498_length_4288_cov_3.110289_5_plen_62_part_00